MNRFRCLKFVISEGTELCAIASIQIWFHLDHLKQQRLLKCVAFCTYEWSPWTPPSTCADIVRFSNFNSPEYIIELKQIAVLSNMMHKVNIYTHTHTHTHTHNSPEDRETLCPDVLAAMLDTCYKVRYKLVDGALVLDWTWHTLGHLHIVTLTVDETSTT